MHRTIVSAGVLLACLLVAMPAMAQRYQWNSDRPDGHAPAGVKADFTLPVGEIYVGYRYFEEKFRGALVGTVEFTSEEVLDFFTVATPTYDRAVHEVELRFGVTDWGYVGSLDALLAERHAQGDEPCVVPDYIRRPR